MKKLITSLGTGDYTKCIYTGNNGFTSTPTRYAQTALFEYLRNNNEHVDEVYLFLTKEAKQDNYFDHRDRKGVECEGLKTIWKQKFPNDVDRLKIIDIPSGQFEEDQWSIFETIFQVIEDGDELYFDITHSFRSIPFIMLLISNFAKVIKGASIQRLFYGNIEVLRSLGVDIKKIALEERVAPIVDITSMVNLLDWSTSVESFLRTGNPGQIDQLANTAIKQDRTNTSLHMIKRLTLSLGKLHKMMETSRGESFLEELPIVRKHVHDVSMISAKSMPQIPKLMDQIKEKVSLFSEDQYENLWGSIKWCVDHGLFQQAITLAREHIITVVFDQLLNQNIMSEPKTDDEGRDIREMISSIIEFIFNPKASFEIEEDDPYAYLINPVEKIIKEKEDAFRSYQTIATYRNNVNHAEKYQDTLPYTRIEARMNEIVEKIKPIFFM